MADLDAWQIRLHDARDSKELTDLHVRILLFTREAIKDGDDQMSHAAVSESLKVSIRVVGDAYRRARKIGLLEWKGQFRNMNVVRRRTVNRYWLIHLEQAPKPSEEPTWVAYSEYLRTPEWRHKRKGALHRALYRCQLCNISGNTEVLQVHHRSYETLGRELPSDLVVLCKPCHARHHRVFARS